MGVLSGEDAPHPRNKSEDLSALRVARRFPFGEALIPFDFNPL